MLHPITTTFVDRLRNREEAAWFELWEIFGPVIRAHLARWGRGAIGPETARDLTQETLAQLSGSIDRFDPTRGVRFSTWLLSIARHVFGDEVDRRMAGKRGSGRRALSIEVTAPPDGGALAPDEQYERQVFRAKVMAAIRSVETRSDFLSFQMFQMRVLEGVNGRDVADRVGVSEPTVSRHAAKVRDALRGELVRTIAAYSFTEEESREAERAGLAASDAAFDAAVADIYRAESRGPSGARAPGSSGMVAADGGRRADGAPGASGGGGAGHSSAWSGIRFPPRSAHL